MWPWPDASAIARLHWASRFYAHVPALYTYAHMAAASRRSGCSRRDVYLPVAIVRVVAPSGTLALAHSRAARGLFFRPYGPRPPQSGSQVGAGECLALAIQLGHSACP